MMFLPSGPFGKTKRVFLFVAVSNRVSCFKRTFFVASWLRVGFIFFVFSSPLFAGSFQLKLGKLFAQGRTLEMESAIASRLKKDPAFLDLWLELADLRESQGDTPGAVLAYQKYLSQKNDWKTAVSLALVLERMGKFPEAEPSLTGLAKDHPNDPDLLWGLARLRLYQSKWKSIRSHGSSQDSLQEAEKVLKKLTGLKPEFALGVWELAETARALGETDLALSSYEKVLRQDASYKGVYRHIAELLVQKGRIREALAKFEKAAAVEPDDLKLKQEARQAALSAPKEVQGRKDERMREWRGWNPPEEKPLASSAATLRVGLFTGMGRILFRGDSDLQVETPSIMGSGEAASQNPITLLSARQEYHVIYYPPRKGRPESWTLNDSKEKILVRFSQRIWIEPKDPVKPICLHAVPSNSGYFFAREEDRAYRGLIEIAPKPGAGFTVINWVALEDYTAGVLSAEMSSHWPIEALKAQAILVRGYALSKKGRHNAEGFDVCDDVHCQVYQGLIAETPRTNQAVNETQGLVLKHRGRIIPAVFSSQCGGHTQDYAEAWGYPEPVVGVADYDPRYNQDMEFPLSPNRMERWIKEDRPAWCRVSELRDHKSYRWAWVVSAAELQKKSGAIGRVRRLIVTHRSSAGWADHLLVEGTAGTKELKGDSIRSFLGGIRSNLIWIEPQWNLKGWPEEFIIYGGGWGHGVGMCQAGAYGLAKGGKTYEDILEHYFPKGDIKKLDPEKIK